MNSLTLLKNGIAQKLSTAIKGVDFCADYNASEFLYSLKRPLVCIFLKGLSTSSGVMGDFLLNKAVDSTSISTYGKSVAIELGVQIFGSSSKGSESCDDVFTSIAEAIVLDSEIDLESITCQSTKYSHKQEVFSLDASLNINMLLAKELHSQFVSSFSVDITI